MMQVKSTRCVVVVGALFALGSTLLAAGCSSNSRMSEPPPMPPAQAGSNAIANDPNIPPQIKARILSHAQANPGGPQQMRGFAPGHPRPDNSKATKS